MNKKLHQFFTGMLVILLTLFCLAPASTGATNEEMATVINLAGKQRMLTQKMSKEALLIVMGVDAPKNRENLGKTAALFDKTLKGLLNGDSTLKLVKTENPDIVAQLNTVSGLWKEFHKSVKSVLGEDVSEPVLAKIASQNLPLLKNMNKAVGMFEKESGSKLEAGLAVTINLAGKQRMLTQKMTKEMLLVAKGINADKNKANLKATVALFEKTLSGLLDGDKKLGLPGTKDAAIRDQLAKVGKLWNDYKPVLDNAVAGKEISKADLEKAAKLNLPLLKEMNNAVTMYAK